MIYDCIVIGGGPAGSTAAFTLARSKFRVLVIDRLLRKPKFKIGESLSGQGVHLLKRSGLISWAQRSRPLDNPGDLSSWGAEELISKDFIFDTYGNGWHLDRVAFDASLRQAASSSGAIFSDVNIRHAERNQDSTWTLHITGEPLRALADRRQWKTWSLVENSRYKTREGQPPDRRSQLGTKSFR